MKMQIQPIESKRAKFKELKRTFGIMILILLVLFGVGSLLFLVRSIYSDFYELKYNTKISELELIIQELENEIEDLELTITRKDEEINKLNDVKVNVQRSVTPAVTLSNISEPITVNISTWDFQSTEVTNISNATPEQINILIKQILESRNGFYDDNHPLADIGDTLSFIENEEGISATFILAILTWESGFCDYDAGWSDEYRNSNNCAGIMDDTNPRYFKNINECILYLGELLRDVYVDKHNLSSISEIGVKYCETPQWGDKVENTTLNYNEKLNSIINLEETQ